MLGFAAALQLAWPCGPEPPRWPVRFSILQRRIPDDGSGNATTTTYYDSEQGANLILISPDSNRSDVLWDLELDTRTSYYFTPSRRSCTVMGFPVGILRPDWLSNATLLGARPCPFATDKTCIGWTKSSFIDYYAYADSASCEPAAWYFWDMKATFVTLSYSEGAAAPAGSFVPPPYCNATDPPR